MIVVIAEKPAVARDLAKVLGATKRGEGYLEGAGYIVTWAVGHLVSLAQPHEIQPEWRHWRAELLPIVPHHWPLVVYEATRSQFDIVRGLINWRQVERLICATDAGREGELIFRYIYEASGCRKPVERLWISSLTAESIRSGFERLKDAREFDRLADAARGRSRADWLVGMNLSRAYTLACGEDLSVGRVQTPTLAMVVDRELAIRAFVPEDYCEVVVTFTKGEAYRGTFIRGPEQRDSRLPADAQEAEAILARARVGTAKVASSQAEKRRSPPPQLYDLTELQRHANILYGFTAKKTLDLAQALYERHKVLSYPRTDSRYLSRDVAATLSTIVAAIVAPYESLVADGTGARPLGRRFVDDAKVGDHHAIIPTTRSPAALDEDERKIYDLVCRRLLAAWHDDHVSAITTVITAISAPDTAVADHYITTGTAVEQQGWRVLDVVKKRGPTEADLPGGLVAGLSVAFTDGEVMKKQTRPPRRYTEATLLTAMETAGRSLDAKELSDAMRDSGLGTPATRAAIIETLLARDYLCRDAKTLVATDKGIRLIEVVHADVKSPIMTGAWEAELKRIERGQGALPDFMKKIESYVREVVARALAGGHAVQTQPSATKTRQGALAASKDLALPAPRHANGAVAASQLGGLLKEAFGFDAFRPYQETVCRAATEGHDVLLVMPTGAGKSLCYQLPGIARGGTTLVISPLVALMDDQVAKLQGWGFAAERIHSGRDRATQRAISEAYLAGALDFLFIAPERLSVPGFPELLARRKPALIAIDEAHCISQWGHDFRPDYRMIGQRLPALRPTPVLAVTATATPLVQTDIVSQLGLGEPLRFIHGFRRTNIAIEVVELSPSERAATARQLLRDPANCPAIIYAPTRKHAEKLAEELGGELRVAAYHAGLRPAARERVQSAFLAGQTDVIVATIAFGMGIDKADVRTVIHTALPSSVEAYYQEIGRAGRDGKPSRAVLMHSFIDRKMHEFFLDRDYPEPTVLQKVFAALKSEPQAPELLRELLRLDEDAFEKAVEKLWIHKGALIEPDGKLRRGSVDWRVPYKSQRDHKVAQLALMGRYAEAQSCRMAQLVEHFGETSSQVCGLCDICAPNACLVQTYRAPLPGEVSAIVRIVTALVHTDHQAAGRLFNEHFGDGLIDRRAFEQLLASMARTGYLKITEDSFEKDGRPVAFRRISLTAAGRAISRDPHSAALTVTIPRSAKSAPAKQKRKRAGAATKERKGARSAPRPYVADEPKELAEGERAPSALMEALRTWRLAEAKRARTPAFCIMTDRAMRAIAESQPRDEDALLATPGMGRKLVEKYGAKIISLVSQSR